MDYPRLNAIHVFTLNGFLLLNSCSVVMYNFVHICYFIRPKIYIAAYEQLPVIYYLPDSYQS
jgi:hypothetical protein